MPKSSPSAPGNAKARAEKLSILSTMLGPDAMARVRDAHPGGSSDAVANPMAVDADRAAWHRNRLLARLRQQGGATPPRTQKSQLPKKGQSLAETITPAKPKVDGQFTPSNGKPGLDARLARYTDFATLDREHPAIITRLVKSLSCKDRVEVLKSLPGPLARLIVRRLK